MSKPPAWMLRVKVWSGLVLLAIGAATAATARADTDMLRGLFLLSVGAFIVAISVEVTR